MTLDEVTAEIEAMGWSFLITGGPGEWTAFINQGGDDPYWWVGGHFTRRTRKQAASDALKWLKERGE